MAIECLTVRQLIAELEEVDEKKKDLPVMVWLDGDRVDVTMVDDSMDDVIDINTSFIDESV